MRARVMAALGAVAAMLIAFGYASLHADGPAAIATTTATPVATTPPTAVTTTVPRVAATNPPTAIDFAATDLEGNPYSGASLRGKVVLLDFWAVWCAPCITAIPKLNHLQEELADYDFEVVGMAVNSGPVEDVRKFAAEHEMHYRVVVGGEELPYRYGVIGYPTYFLIDRQGEQVRKFVGALPDLEERIIAEVKALASGSNS